MVSSTAHDLVVDVRDYVVDFEAGRVGRAVWVHLYDQMVYGILVRVVREHFNGADGEAEASVAAFYGHFWPAQAHLNDFVQFFLVVRVMLRVALVGVVIVLY